MLHTWQHLSLGCFIATELVCDYHPWYVLAALEQLAEELLSCTLVAAALNQDVQHVALLVYSPPEGIDNLSADVRSLHEAMRYSGYE